MPMSAFTWQKSQVCANFNKKTVFFEVSDHFANNQLSEVTFSRQDDE